MIVTESLAAPNYKGVCTMLTLGAFFVPSSPLMVGAKMGFYARRAFAVLLTSLPPATHLKGRICPE